jgi:hypothetical protein
VLHRVLRAYRERITGQTGLPAMTSAALIGFYRLDDLNVRSSTTSENDSTS